MAMPLALVFDLIATDHASAVFQRVGHEAGAAGKATEGFGAKIAKMGAVIGIAAIGAAVVSTKMAADFQTATTLLVTGAGESEKSIDMVSKGLLAMAPAVGIGPTALAKAMFLVESAGYHGATALTVMKAAAEGAKIGGADATVVANGLTTALTDYNLPASKAAEITSKLVATVAAGKTNMGDLSASLSTVLPFAASLGVKFNDVAGAMATMTGEGIDAATSATELKFTMMSMANETPKGAKALKSIGMTAQQLKDDLASQGVGGALQTVTDMIGKKFPAGSAEATKALAAIAGGTRGMGAALALTGTHAAAVVGNIKNIGGASTEAGGHVKGWNLTSKDLAVQLAKITALVQEMAVKIGDKLIPILSAVMTWMSKNGETVKIIAVALGILAAAFIGVSIATWAMNSALLASPITWIILGVAALVAALVFFFTQTKLGKEIWHNTMTAIGAAFNWLWTSVIKPVISFIGTAIHVVGDIFKWLYENIVKPVFDGIGAVFKWIYDTIIKPTVFLIKLELAILAAVFTWMYNTIIKPVFDAIGAVFNWIYNNVIKPIAAVIAIELKGLGIVFKWLHDNVIKPVFDAIGKVFNWLWTSVIKPVADFIGGAIHGIGDVVGKVFGAIGGVIEGAFNGVVGFVKGIFNTIIGLVNGIIDGINSIPGIAAAAGAMGIKMPLTHIPKLADGATILPRQGGTLVIAGEGGKAESVVDTGKLNKLLDSANSGGGHSSRPIYMDGTLFGVLKELANGEAQIVVNAASSGRKVDLSTGMQKVAY